MWAHKGPYGPGPGPYEGEALQEKRKFYTIILKIAVFAYKYNVSVQLQLVLQISGQNTFQNDYEITSKIKFWNQSVRFWYLHLPALINSLYNR